MTNMNNKLRIGFMGTPDFSVTALDALINSGHEVVAVYSQPPKPSGRGQKIHKSAVHSHADTLKIEVFTPKSLRTEEAQTVFKAHNLDICVVVAYGLILPIEVLEAPKYGCLNIHASLLPRWRGAAPIQRAIMAGDTQSGVCIMQMDKGLDTGDVLSRQTTPITSNTTAQTLHDSLSSMGAEMVVDVVNNIANGAAPTPEKQTEDGMTYAKMLSREDGRINWSNSAIEIDRQLRALTPWPGVWFTLGDQHIKLHSVTLSEASGTPATLLDKDMTIACGEGALQLTSIQPPNKKPMDGKSYLNGSSLNIGDLLS